MRLTRLLLLGILLAPLTTAAGGSSRPSSKPAQGALHLTPLTPYLSVCLGEQPAVDILVTDAVYGMPRAPAAITMTSSLAAPATAISPGGLVRLVYQPSREGTDRLQITATAPGSASGATTVTAKVQRCRWTWDLFYTGTFPHPQGFWKFSEQATVAAGTLETVGDSTLVQGSGMVAYAISAHGEVTQASCDFAEMTGTTNVKVDGLLGKPPGSMELTFVFDKAPISGSASFNCRFGPDQVTFEIPVNEVSAALSSLPLKNVVVPTDFGMISRPVPRAVFWLISGSGQLTLIVTPESND